LRLLAALLRLADELHCTYTRVPELSEIDSPVLDDTGKAHWAACYYTEDVRITSPGSGGLRFHMSWRIPDSGEDSDMISSLLQELRDRKVREECQLIGEYLKLDDAGEKPFLEFQLEPNPSLGNLQSYEIYMVRDVACRQVLSRAALGQSYTAAAPIVLVFCTNPERAAARYGQ
jgi:hypothetical protein